MTPDRRDAIIAYAVALPGDPFITDALRLTRREFGIAYEEARELFRSSGFPRQFRKVRLRREEDDINRTRDRRIAAWLMRQSKDATFGATVHAASKKFAVSKFHVRVVATRCDRKWRDPRTKMVDADGDTSESREDARARVAEDVAAGRRCSRCWLLAPCFTDHLTRPDAWARRSSWVDAG